MADIDRQNEIIYAASQGRREECRNAAERKLYDSVVAAAARMAQYGIVMDTVHENADD